MRVWSCGFGATSASRSAGVVLSFVAAACQQLGIAVHPIYFDHNAVYHAIQALALALIFVGLQGLLSSTPEMLRSRP
jgi:Family of unknown function (DUF6962)